MVLEWPLTPEEASLLQDRPFSAAASVYISRTEAWVDSEISLASSPGLPLLWEKIRERKAW